MTQDKTASAFEVIKQFIEENPYKGTSKQIVNLSISIAESAATFDPSVFALYKEQTGISPKIFSKLKVIGETLLKVDKKQRKDLINQLPASYTTIHILCSLKVKDLLTAAKKKVVTPTITAKEASAFAQQIRFPNRTAIDGEKGKWGYKQEHLFNIVRPDDVQMSGEVLNIFKNELRKVCLEYGAHLQVANPLGTTPLRKQERNDKSMFWKSILKKELDQKWFNKIPESIKNEFNINTLKDLHEAPIRSFTGFIIKASGGKETYWEKHSQAYIAKLQILSEITEEARQRYNYRKRLENILREHKELEIWNNLILKEGGFIEK